MVVAILVLEMRLSGCRSLKDKRQILRSLLSRSRREWNVSIAEVGDQDLWGNALVCASYPSNDPAHAESVLDKVQRLFDAQPEVEVSSVFREAWRPL